MPGRLKRSCLIVGWIAAVLIEIAGLVGSLPSEYRHNVEWLGVAFWGVLFLVQVRMAWRSTSWRSAKPQASSEERVK